jgi:hypothetical protein
MSRRPLVVAAGVVAAVLVGFLGWRALSGDDSRASGTGPVDSAPPGPSIDGAPPVALRATGPGTCAFLSTDDVSRAAGGALPVELQQTVAPSGDPGCEWSVGKSGEPLYVLFDAGGGAGSGLAGADSEPVDGPWLHGQWSATARTLSVDEGTGQVFGVVAGAEDPTRARQLAYEIAVLVAARN